MYGNMRVHVGFWLEDLKERDHMEDRREWGNNIKMDLQEVSRGVTDGFTWLRIVTGSGCL